MTKKELEIWETAVEFGSLPIGVIFSVTPGERAWRYEKINESQGLPRLSMADDDPLEIEIEPQTLVFPS